MLTIVYTDYKENDLEVSYLKYMIDNGADYIFIRKPEVDTYTLVDFIEKFDERYHKKMLTTSLILCKEFDMAGYHFTRTAWENNKDYNYKLLEWLKLNNKISSKSAHSVYEIKTLYNLFNQLIISPIYKSISKKDYFYQWNLKEIKELRSMSVAKFIGVGGVNITNIQELKTHSFDGIGILGAIWDTDKGITSAFNDIINIVHE